MSSYEVFGVVNGVEYRATVYGRGTAIAIDRVGAYGSGFFAQGEDAGEYTDLIDEHGLAYVVDFLIAAGVEFA